jgi:hypothetical protein
MDWEDIAQKILRKYYTLFDRRLNPKRVFIYIPI